MTWQLARRSATDERNACKMLLDGLRGPVDPEGEQLLRAIMRDTQMTVAEMDASLLVMDAWIAERM